MCLALMKKIPRYSEERVIEYAKKEEQSTWNRLIVELAYRQNIRFSSYINCNQMGRGWIQADEILIPCLLYQNETLFSDIHWR